MRLQLLRSSNRIIGVALVFSKADQILCALELPKPEPTFWRICDSCTANEAMVFCRDHSLYLCEYCLPRHKSFQEFNNRYGIAAGCCSFLSMAAARAMITQNAKHEAHT